MEAMLERVTLNNEPVRTSCQVMSESREALKRADDVLGRQDLTLGL